MRTVRDSIQPFLSERMQSGAIRPNTARQYRYTLYMWADVCGDRPLDRLSQTDVERFAASFGNVAPATRNMRYTGLRAWHRWAVQRKLVAATLLDRLEPVRQPRRPPRSMTARQVSDVIAAAPDSRARAIIIWSVQLGLRCCELASLTLADVDLDAKRVRVIGKAGHERVLPIPDEAIEALNDYWGDVGLRAGPLFRLEGTNKPMRAHYLSKLLSRYFVDAGVKRQSYDGLSAHALRHTMATDLLRSRKATLVQVKHALGHASVATTQIYVSALESEELAEVMSGRSYVEVD